MKKILSILLFSFCLSAYGTTGAHHFEQKLAQFIKTYKKGILDRDFCEHQKKLCDSFYGEVEHYKKGPGITNEDISGCEAIQKKIFTLRNYIDAITVFCQPITEAEFMAGNNLVGGIITEVNKGKYCMPVVKIVIGKYIVFAVKNNSSKSTTVEFDIVAKGVKSYGSGTLDVPANSLWWIDDNHMYPEKKQFTVSVIKCGD